MANSILLRSRVPIIAGLLLLPQLVCWSQKKPAALASYAPPSSSPADDAPDFRVIRRIDDPATHLWWLLVQDRKRSAAPARLVAGSANFNGIGGMTAECAALKKTMLVHAGDSVIVEEHTGTVDARLEAIALDSAAAGDPLTIRLKIGGRILRARAIELGRVAMLSAGQEGRP